MDTKILIVGIAGLILGALGGFMLSGTQSQTMTEEKMRMMMNDPQTREMIVDELMTNDEIKQMMNEKLMMEKENETMRKDENTDDTMMQEENIPGDESMMKDKEKMMEEVSPTGP